MSAEFIAFHRWATKEMGKSEDLHSLRASFIYNKCRAKYTLTIGELIYFSKYLVNRLSPGQIAAHCHAGMSESALNNFMQETYGFTTFPEELNNKNVFEDQEPHYHYEETIDLPTISLTRDVEFDYDPDEDDIVTESDVIKMRELQKKDVMPNNI
jgi:hypothetical protein